jgi:hypothetical protein
MSRAPNRHKAQVCDLLNEQVPLYLLPELQGDVGSRIGALTDDDLPRLGGAPLLSVRGDIIAALNDSDLTNPRPLLRDFLQLLRDSITARHFCHLFNTWPPRFPDDPPVVRLIYFVLGVVRGPAARDGARKPLRPGAAAR